MILIPENLPLDKEPSIRTLHNNETTLVAGGDGLTFVNDAARALGGLVADAVDAVQTEMFELDAEFRNAVWSHAFNP